MNKTEKLKKEIEKIENDGNYLNENGFFDVKLMSTPLYRKRRDLIAELKGRQEREQEILEKIKTAGRCLAFQNFKCKSCLNKFCPAYIEKGGDKSK